MKLLNALATICFFTCSVIAAEPIGNSAILKISPSPTSPKAGLVIASLGSNKDEADKVTGLIFNAQANGGDVKITNITAGINGTASCLARTAYLFDGSKEIDNTAVVNGTIAFDNLDIVVSKDTIKSLSIKYDIRSATITGQSLGISLGTITAKDSQNVQTEIVYVLGQITSPSFLIQSSGPVFSLIGTPVLGKTECGTSTTYSASFTFDVDAVGEDLAVKDTDFVIGIYANGQLIAQTTALYKKPTSGVTGSSTTYTISENNKARFTVTTLFNSDMVYCIPGYVFTARLDSAMGYTFVSETFRATKDNTGKVVTF